MFESQQFSEQEKKNKELSEQEKKQEIQKTLEFKAEKQKIIDKTDAAKNLNFLKSVVERWLIDLNVVKNIVEWKDLNNEEIEHIFEKIDEIESVENVDNILPKELRITKEEYLTSLKDYEFRQQILAKLDEALGHLYMSSNPNFDMMWIFGMVSLLNKNLVKVQENTIDIKNNLLDQAN